MKRSRVLIIGDSLSIPRVGCPYENTWVYQFKMAHPAWDIITLCEGGRSTSVLLLDRAATGANSLGLYRPDLIVLQLGIVDCAPRLFRQNSWLPKILRRMPRSIAEGVLCRLKRWRGRRVEYAYVSPEQFQYNLETYFKACANAKVRRVVVIAIAHPDERMIVKSPHILQSIELYNSIYRRLAEQYPFVKVVEPLGAQADSKPLYSDDGYHLLPRAHDLVWNALEQTLDNTTYAKVV